ncbi:FMN-binding protein [Arthrobacter sp. Leaf337]|uniref:FMN-binding protein n=1 Tax=Arthrobacter sp. Leaf337 TaxID=1736342 RepID=UPI0006FB4A56|nr:FMN-binding protein [Arthrobacter sp. Leaf337]KQR76846.1 FMN-binding protein [Arthrobacter sp. Leaf337]
MRIRAAVSAALASAGILLAGWQSGIHVEDTRSAAASTSAGINGTTGTTGATGATGSTGSSSSSSGSTDTGASGTGSSGAGTGTAGTDSGAAAEPTTGAAAKAGGTYTGSVVQTRFGAVQVQITVKAGAITDVEALQLTDDDRKSVQISNRAAPLLRSEVLAAQSADVQTIGGATVTSVAYLNSLQAAIDAANL